jgi:hypothetical protein
MMNDPCACRQTCLRTIFSRSAKHLVLLSLLLLAGTLPLAAAQPLPVTEDAQRQPAAEASPETGVMPESAADPAETARRACFERVWSDYQNDVWFYGEDGRRVLPRPDLKWLVVRLADGGPAPAGSAVESPAPVPADTSITPAAPENTAPETTDSGPDIAGEAQAIDSPTVEPPSFDTLNERYGEYFSHILYDPLRAPSTAAYRLRRDLSQEAYQSLLTRLQQDRMVRYAHPAWNIGDRLFAPLEQIEIIWKTASDARRRQALLQAVAATADGDGPVSSRQQVTIDPCWQSVWESANLLAEDILVEQARPLLMPLVPPVGVRFSLGMNGATPGTPIPFVLEIRFTERIKIESSTIANLNLKPSGIFHNLYDISYDAPLSAIDLNHSPIRITGKLRIYATGEYSIPGIPVYYIDSRAPQSQVQLIKTVEEPVRIAAMIPESTEGFDLQVAAAGPLTVPGPRRATTSLSLQITLLAVGLLLSGLAAVATWWWRKNIKEADIQPENHVLNQLQTDVDNAIAAVRQHGSRDALAGLGVALKAYLAEFSGIAMDRQGGSHVSFLRRIEATLPASARQAASEVLACIDHSLAQETAGIPEDLTARAGWLIETLQGSASPAQPSDEPEPEHHG